MTPVGVLLLVCVFAFLQAVYWIGYAAGRSRERLERVAEMLGDSECRIDWCELAEGHSGPHQRRAEWVRQFDGSECA